MIDRPYEPGGDAKVIAEIAKRHFSGFAAMFERHDWPERGADMMRKVQSRVVETYGSVRAFETYFQEIERFSEDAKTIWPDHTSVFLTSLWGWQPETWGTIGWSHDRGHTRRRNLLTQLSNPFICVCYITSNKTETDPELKGKLGGFYLVSHEIGDRDQFSHPVHHRREPAKWRHSLRAIRAFNFLPEYRPKAMDVFPELSRTARHVAAMGEIITDPIKIDELRSIPWIETPVYSPLLPKSERVLEQSSLGLVPAGPAAATGYSLSEGNAHLPRELYVLRLDGDTAAYLGQSVNGTSIYKIGLSVSPDLRRQSLQKAMPRGAFHWRVERTTRADGHAPYNGFAAAVAGEDAMKSYLARNADWLGGEFYLATEADIDAAWVAGRQSALRFQQEGSDHVE